ncbi:hypothetical protein QV65_04040 [Rhodococcus erythropolis]|nr:hypothetical protein QV65_04040 [Rhodococcus erythropolis]
MLAHDIGVEADAHGQLDQHLTVVDHQAVAEVRFEQRFEEFVLPLTREMQQPVRIKGIGGDHGFEVQGQPDLGGRRADVGEHLTYLIRRHPLHFDQGVEFGSPLSHRGLRSELVRAPDDVDAVLVLETIQRREEPGLSDVAPRTSDVRPHFDGHVLVNHDLISHRRCNNEQGRD